MITIIVETYYDKRSIVLLMSQLCDEVKLTSHHLTSSKLLIMSSGRQGLSSVLKAHMDSDMFTTASVV